MIKKNLVVLFVSFFIITTVAMMTRINGQEIGQPMDVAPEVQKEIKKAETPPMPQAVKPAPEEQKQRITTPAMQLTEEEEKRAPKTKVPETKTMGAVQFKPIPLKTKTKILLIMDASGSMNGLMGASTKMAIAKSVLNNVITQPIPEELRREIGLRIYGGQNPSEANDCKDTQLLIPIRPIDKMEFKKQLENINALGVAPIGFALEEASKDFEATADTDNVIVLITDGADSCNANVCQIAEKIHSEAKKIIVHVIGFDLDQKAIDSLNCVAKNADGKMVVARSENELHSAVDQVMMANVPYNLRIKVASGATPLPSTLRVYKSGTQNLVREDQTSGTQFYQLSPGTYDIEIIYSGSKETPLPLKILKNVEVQATSKAEQIVQFDLGMLNLAAFDQKGEPTAAKFTLTKPEEPQVKVEYDADSAPFTLMLTEGTYNAIVEAKTPEGLPINAGANGLKVAKSEATTHEFRFQVGIINLIGKNSKGEQVSLSYRLTPPGDDQKTLLQGTTPLEGKLIDVPPGKYDLFATPSIENLKDLSSIKVGEVEIMGGDTIEKIAEIPTASVKLSARDATEKEVPTLFTIKVSTSEETPAEFKFEKEPISLTIPPGTYDIKATLLEAETTPPPTMSWNDIAIAKDQEIDKIAYFRYGILKLFGKDTRGVPVQTSFYVFRVGEDQPIATIIGTTVVTSIRLLEGAYDIRAEDTASSSEPKPGTWFHNIRVTPEKETIQEVIFTSGKLKIVCKGSNDESLECDYKVFTYGTDRPLFEGTTIQRWKQLDIPPGNYYIEAGFHDEKDEVLLKKWISIQIKTNEMLEETIRF